jgi:hypothetical protein
VTRRNATQRNATRNATQHNATQRTTTRATACPECADACPAIPMPLPPSVRSPHPRPPAVARV